MQTETSDESEEPGEPTEERADAERADDEPAGGWRDDPLSIFLVVAMVLLLAMLWYEDRQSSTMAERRAQATALAEKYLSGAPCTTGVAGTQGQILTISCEERDVPGLVAGRFAEAGVLDVEEVYLVGPSGAWSCGGDPGRWGDGGCEARERPSTQQMERAAERARQKRLQRR